MKPFGQIILIWAGDKVTSAFSHEEIPSRNDGNDGNHLMRMYI